VLVHVLIKKSHRKDMVDIRYGNLGDYILFQMILSCKKFFQDVYCCPVLVAGSAILLCPAFFEVRLRSIFFKCGLVCFSSDCYCRKEYFLLVLSSKWAIL